MKAVLTFTDEGSVVRATIAFDPPVRREDRGKPCTAAVAMAFEALLAVRDWAGEVEVLEPVFAADEPPKEQMTNDGTSSDKGAMGSFPHAGGAQ